MFVAVQPRVPDFPLPTEQQLDGRLRELFPGAAHMLSTVRAESADLTLYAWLRLDNADELAATLGVSAVSDGDRFARDSALVLAAYRRWGADCAAHLEGDFALVILDGRTNTAYAARDATGIRPLYYAITPQVFAASPSAGVFDLIPGVDTSVSDGWLADYIQGMSGQWSQTPLAGVRRLPPGHWLQVTPADVVERQYHRFDDESGWEDSRDPQWLESYRTELIRAVSVRTQPEGLIGVETSGGIDSSTILGVMAHTHPERIADIHTFGFVHLQDEPEFILQTSAAHGIVHNHILSGGAVGRAEERRAWRAIGYPTEHSNAVGHSPFYSLAQQLGIRTLHSGHGGDETVTNAAGLALHELVSRRQWRQALRDLPGHVALRPARLAKLMTRRTGDVSRLTAPMLSRLELTPLREDVVAARDMVRRTRERARYDAPHTRVNDFVLGDRLSAGTSIRTADGSLVAATYGIDYRWALLDRRLIQQYLHTPSVWKYGEGYGRYLHRRAIAGMVPDKVAWKPSKDMGDPFGAQLRQIPPAVAADVRGVAAPPDNAAQAMLERINPRLRDLLDAERLQQGLQRAARRPATVDGFGDPQARVTRRLLNQVQLLSDWLDDREGRA